MSKKKITLTIMSIVIAILIMIIPSITKASTTLTTPLYFGINEFRNGTTPDKMGYAIFNPYANGATEDSIVGTKIWQIVKYDSKTSNNMITGNYYCVRAGVGLSDTNKRAEYTIAYDLKTEKDKIEKSGNTVLNKIVTNGQYNNLLALADLVYLKGVSTDSEKTGCHSGYSSSSVQRQYRNASGYPSGRRCRLLRRHGQFSSGAVCMAVP